MTSQFAAVVARLIDSEVLAPKSIAQITSTCRGAERFVRERRLTVVRKFDRITWTGPFGSLASIRRRLRQCAERALTVNAAGREEARLLLMIRLHPYRNFRAEANLAGPAAVDDAADTYHFVLDVVLHSSGGGETVHRVLAPDAVELVQSHDEFDPTKIIINAPHIPPRFVAHIDPEADEDYEDFYRYSTGSIGFAVVRGRDSKICTLFRGHGSAEHIEWDPWGRDPDDREFRCELPNARRLLDMTFPDFSLSLETGATLVCKTDGNATDDGTDSSIDILMHRLEVNMYYRTQTHYERDPPSSFSDFPALFRFLDLTAEWV